MLIDINICDCYTVNRSSGNVNILGTVQLIVMDGFFEVIGKILERALEKTSDPDHYDRYGSSGSLPYGAFYPQ